VLDGVKANLPENEPMASLAVPSIFTPVLAIPPKDLVVHHYMEIPAGSVGRCARQHKSCIVPDDMATWLPRVLQGMRVLPALLDCHKTCLAMRQPARLQLQSMTLLQLSVAAV